MQDYTADKDLANIKLLAVDMDLTLLADDGSQPEGMENRIAALAEAGVVFCPASGRPVPTLELPFPGSAGTMAFCGDNGGNVVYQGKIIYRDRLEPELWRKVAARAVAAGDNVPVLCCYDHAVCLERDRAHFEGIFKYYKNIRWVASYDDVDDDANKISLLFPAYDAEPAFASIYQPEFGEKLYVTNAGREWVDFMNLNVSKGDGVAHLCDHLGIDIADAAAVGDTYNDIPMLERVGHSFIVANAEPHMEAHARYRVPSNNDRGVAVLIDALLAAKQH
ncbi:HAD family hydrolase [Paratractidigestivibacter sp.]|uniref:HAD family hydrolase n=1 Tax=Paratractidigestivibacter sp. TaxID=2847316 RepID=UPI002AC8A31F|nr:HAD family hydrolase [Paratractidigestivibacter sp.]